MSERNENEPSAPEAAPHPDLKHRWAEIAGKIRGGLIGARQVALLQVNVEVDRDGVTLTGEVYTRIEYELIGKIAQRYANGLPIVNEVLICAETTRRANE